MENERLFGLICYLNRTLSRKNDSLLAEAGITDVSGVQLHALICVARAKDKGQPPCQRDLERELGLRPSSVSSMLAKLERDGYIIRTQAEGDARTKFIALTEKGDTLCREHKHAMDSCDAIVQECLTEEERAELKTLIFKIIDSIPKE